MAIIRPTQYPGRWNAVTASAPQGSGKNRTSPTSNDGSYLDQVWFNDMDSLHQALFIASGISPNGTQDVGDASQIFDALINNKWSPIGNYFAGTIVKGSDGLQYYCKSNNGRDSSVVDPTTVTDRNVWVKYPYEEGSNSNGVYKIHFDDSIEQWGKTAPTDANGESVSIFPIPFTGQAGDIFVVYGDIANASSEVAAYGVSQSKTTLTTLYTYAANVEFSGPAINDSANYYAFSKGN